MPRREALRRAAYLLGSAISAPTIDGVLAGCQAPRKPRDGVLPGTGAASRTLSADQREMVLAMGEIILPETDTPGARAAAVDEFIDAMLTDFYPTERRDHFLAGLDRVDARARRAFGNGVTKLSPEQQLELVTTLNRETFQPGNGARAQPQEGEQSFFRTFKELVLVGYYTSEVGATEELRVNPMGPWRADIPYAEVGRAWS
ncbi:MAG: gluconate 2-dehydrogenase subunit 3 family protein [Luteitalea sp.]|nr:gluconate 2-dehydrogenase subunit 3 family protein [Luteitalea sp.]